MLLFKERVFEHFFDLLVFAVWYSLNPTYYKNLILLVVLEQFGLILLHIRLCRAGGPRGLVGSRSFPSE